MPFRLLWRDAFLAVHEIHIIKGSGEKFDEYRKIFDGSSLIRHYGDHVYEWMQQGLIENNVYIAEDGNGEAVGFMWAQLNSMYAEQPYISLLGVRSDYRAHGVGQRLIQHFIDIYEGEGYERGLIAVNDFNPRARILYEDMGFHKITAYQDAMSESNNVYLLMRKSRKHNSNV